MKTRATDEEEFLRNCVRIYRRVEAAALNGETDVLLPVVELRAVFHILITIPFQLRSNNESNLYRHGQP